MKASTFILRLLVVTIATTGSPSLCEEGPRPSIEGPQRNPLSPWYLTDDTRWWRIDGLIGAEIEPDYVGSSESETEPSGFLRGLFRDRFGNRYRVAPGEVGGTFFFGENWAFNLDLEYEEGRETEDTDLANLRPGVNTLEGEFSLLRRFGDGYGFVVFQPDLLARGKGIVYFIGHGYDHLTRDQRWLISPRWDVSWGDREHMQTEFGLTTEQALAIDQTPYVPGGGLKSVTLGLSLQRFLGSRWSALASLEVEHYFSKAADSPLISELGSDINYEASVGFLFRF